MSPLELNILLNIYYSPAWQVSMYSTQEDFLHRLVITGAVNKTIPESDELHGYSLTDMGTAWVEDILATEQPKKVFINAAGKIID